MVHKIEKGGICEALSGYIWKYKYTENDMLNFYVSSFLYFTPPKIKTKYFNRNMETFEEITPLEA